MERSGPSLGLTPRLEARPGLRLLSYLSLLPASAVELDAAIERAVAQNPLLERRPWHTCPTCGLATAGERCRACASAHWVVEPEAEVDWRGDLLRDAAAELPTSLHPLLRLVVASLDDHGLLRDPPDPPGAEPGALDRVVTALRTGGPPGVAARSAVDCVRVQAEALVATGRAPDLVAVVAGHWLAEVAEERYADVAAAVGVTESAVREAVVVLRARTRPYVALPGGTRRSAPTDVVFTLPERDGPVVANVADAAAAGLGVVTGLGPARVVREPEVRAWLAPHREAADRLVAAIAARGHMLQGVADALAVRQRGFPGRRPGGPRSPASPRAGDGTGRAPLDRRPRGDGQGRPLPRRPSRAAAAFFGATALHPGARRQPHWRRRPGATDRGSPPRCPAPERRSLGAPSRSTGCSPRTPGSPVD